MEKELKPIPCPSKCTLRRNLCLWRESDEASQDSESLPLWIRHQINFKKSFQKPSKWPNILALTHSACQNPCLDISSAVGLPDSSMASCIRMGELYQVHLRNQWERKRKLLDLPLSRWLHCLSYISRAFGCQMTFEVPISPVPTWWPLPITM